MKKQHLPLIVGIALPIVFIIIMALVIYLPNISITPAYNFIYSDESGYDYGYSQYQWSYSVQNKKIVVSENIIKNSNIAYKADYPKLYLYDVHNNTSHEISIDEASKYAVDPGPSSPDGYTIKYEYSNNGIFDLFGSSYGDSGYYIEHENGKKRLAGVQSTDRYSSPYYFKLIGWVQ
jgi:hypothetical protein